jgi:predicted secreted protein
LHPPEFGSFVAIVNRPETAGRWRPLLAGMTKEAALLPFNSVLNNGSLARVFRMISRHFSLT